VNNFEISFCPVLVGIHYRKLSDNIAIQVWSGTCVGMVVKQPLEHYVFTGLTLVLLKNIVSNYGITYFRNKSEDGAAPARTT